MVRVPGFEPGFPRWQRGVITTTLRSQRLNEMAGLLLSIGQLGLGRKPSQVSKREMKDSISYGIAGLSEHLNTLTVWVI